MKIILTLTTLLAVFQISAGQNKTIQLKSDANNKSLNLQFYTEGVLVTSYDVLKRNPYRSLIYSSKELDETGDIQFEINEQESILILSPILKNVGKDQFKNYQIKSAKTFNETRAFDNHAVVINGINYFDDSGSYLTAKASIVILNDKGNVVAEIDETQEGFNSPTIVKNGHFLGVLYGGITVHSNHSLMAPPGFRIYDALNSEILFEIKNGQDYSVSPPFSIDNLIIQVLKLRGGLYEYNVFDPIKRIVYKKIYSVEDRNKLKKITPKGFVFSGAREETYENNFSKSTF